MSLFRTWTGQSQKSQKSYESASLRQEMQSQTGPPQNPRRPSKSELNKITSNSSNADPYAGHLNHLTEQQASQLDKFKSTLSDHGLFRPATAGQAASHDDQTLLRYLRARKFEISGACAQFKDTEDWSKENKIAELYETIDVDFYERAKRMYPQWTGRQDKRGIPVYVYVVKHIDSKNVNAYTKEAAAYKRTLPYHSSLNTPAKMLPLFALYENLLRFALPFCTSLEDRPHPEVPITNSNNIVDINGVSLKQFWNLKNHMQEASVLATAHYPETLDKIFIIGAPSFFPTVWGWIKRWFDPVTVNKIFILSNHEVKSRLSEYIHPDDFPKKYGGNLDWEVGMPPHLNEAARQVMEKTGPKEWIGGPCLWEHEQRVPVGTVGGKLRRPAKLEPVPVPAQRESGVVPHPSMTDGASENTAAHVPVAAITPIPAYPVSAETSNSPSMAQSGSTAATFVDTPSETTNTSAKNGNSIRVLDSEAPLVANGEVLPAGATKPPMERFVTALEDLSLAKPQ